MMKRMIVGTTVGLLLLVPASCGTPSQGGTEPGPASGACPVGDDDCSEIGGDPSDPLPEGRCRPEAVDCVDTGAPEDSDALGARVRPEARADGHGRAS